MRVLFICGSLEPGRDGVGDYSRRLAGELIRGGHGAALVSINDRFVADSAGGKVGEQFDGETAIPVLRLGRNGLSADGLRAIQAFAHSFGASHCSLQYVPYAFHPKGLPFALGRRLKCIGPISWHVMFHELWVGFGDRPLLKHRAVGAFQRGIAHRLIRSLQPVAVHTQATPYVSLLRGVGVAAERLPLFSNIPVVAPAGEVDRIENHMACREIRFAFFGSVLPGWNVHETARILRRPFSGSDTRLKIVAIGRGGPHAASAWNGFRGSGMGIDVAEAGEVAQEEVSRLLHSCDYGLSSYPPDLIEKSGSAAAMFEHGLSVIATRLPIWGQRFIGDVSARNQGMVHGADLESYSVFRRRPAQSSIVKMAAENLAAALLL